MDARTFGSPEQEAWLTLSYLARVKARATPTAGVECYRICSSDPTSRSVVQPASCSAANGSVSCTPPLVKITDTCGPAGRVPFGLLPARPEAAGEVECFWLSTEHLEAASVFAFAELAVSLEHHAAPSELVARCRSAAEKEREHARLAGVELRAMGLATVPVRRYPPAAPTLLDVALHNAAEGCVNESVAALLALHESTVNADPAMRSFFGRIAADECEHAELAWDLHRGFLETLPAVDARTLVLHLQAAARAAQRAPVESSRLSDARARHSLRVDFVGRLLAHTRGAEAA